MTQKWHEVTATKPCPACEKPDWCAWAPDRAMLKCQRSVDPPAGYRLVKRLDGDGTLFAPITEIGTNGKNRLGTIVKTYDYTDERGKVLFQVVRYQPKDFRQRRPDGKGGYTWNLKNVRRVLYRLRELLSATLGTTIYICEGEKDVDLLISLGLVATTNSGGAGKWDKLSDDAALHGRHVAIIPDADGPGRKHAQHVAQRLYGEVASIKIVEVPKGKDASDFFDAGGTAEDLQRLVDAAPVWQGQSVAAATGLGLEPDDDDDEERLPRTAEEARRWLRRKLHLDIIRLEKIGSAPAAYDLILVGEVRVRLGTAAALLTPRQVQAAVLDATKLILPRFSRGRWERIVRALTLLLVDIHSDEIDDGKHLRDTLYGYIGTWNPLIIHTQDPGTIAEALLGLRRGESRWIMDEEKRGYFSPTGVREHMVTLLREPVSARDLARSLTRAGFTPVQLAVKREGKVSKSRFWRTPRAWLEESESDA